MNISFLGKNSPIFCKKTESDFFKNLKADLSSCWNKLKDFPLSQYTNSLVGRIVKFSVADFVGSAVGSMIGGQAVRAVTLAVKGWMPSGILLATVMGAGQQIIMSSKLTGPSKAVSSIVLATTVCYVMQLSIQQISLETEEIFPALGETIGSFGGTILGGYFALHLVNSPVKFLDQREPENSYSTNNAKYLLTGIFFDAIFQKPSLLLLQIPRNVIRNFLQLMAFNSNTLCSAIRHMVVQNTIPKKGGIPLSVELFLNCYGGNSAKLVHNELSKPISNFIHSSFSPTFVQVAKNLKLTKTGSNIIFSLFKGLEKNVESELPLTLMNSLQNYTQLLKNSIALPKLSNELEDSFTQKIERTIMCENNLVDEIMHLIDHYSPDGLASQKKFLSLVSSKKMYHLLIESNLNELVSENIPKIKEVEVALFGRNFISDLQISRISRAAKIHLRCYFIFTCLYLDSFKHSVSMPEESEFYSSINKIIVHNYLSRACSPFTAKIIYQFTQFSLETILHALKFTKKSSTHFQQSSSLYSNQNLITENYLSLGIDQTEVFAENSLANVIKDDGKDHTSLMYNEEENDFFNLDSEHGNLYGTSEEEEPDLLSALTSETDGKKSGYVIVESESDNDSYILITSKTNG